MQSTSQRNASRQQRLNQGIVLWLVKNIIIVVIVALILRLASGRADWIMGRQSTAFRKTVRTMSWTAGRMPPCATPVIPAA